LKLRSSRSRRAFEEMKRSRVGISEDSQFTADEIEAAGIITRFHFYWRLSLQRWSKRTLFLQWGSKRRRSAIQREESSGICNSKLFPKRDERENDYELQHRGMGMAPPPERRLPPTSRPNSKNVITKNRPRRRAPKKKTRKELTEKANELPLENATLITEVEQMRKTRQVLKDYNVYLKSKLALCLEHWQEKTMPRISRPSSSSHSDTGQKTKTDFQIYDEHGHFEKSSGSSALGSTYDKPQRLGRPMYPCSSESSFVFEKDGAMPTKDTVCSCFLDPNAPDETLLGTNISNDLHNQMPVSKNKASVQR
jgi:hypothetical protein